MQQEKVTQNCLLHARGVVTGAQWGLHVPCATYEGASNGPQHNELLDNNYFFEWLEGRRQKDIVP